MQGQISEEKVNSFNLPIYLPSMKEMGAAIQRNGQFSIEKMEELSNSLTNYTPSTMRLKSAYARIIGKHFGSSITDELFDRYSKKINEYSSFLFNPDVHPLSVLFVLLKRNVRN